MRTRLFVVSDLHLGGSPAKGGEPAFQMCTPAGRADLARFIEWAGGQQSGEDRVHLVVAGDIVDFLAEDRAGGFRAFTNDDVLATRKLAAILDDTKEVWQALSRYVHKGGALTLMLGNHDLELSLAGPRRLLLETLGPGRVEFIYDNQAFTLGRVLVEHGNRYDDWNAVPHDDLREVRSRLSRGQSAEFDPLPGSRMVVDLVNPLKKELAFVDLLKPEDAALLPFLALLAPDRFRQVRTTLKNRVRALRVRYGPGQEPKDRNYIGAEVAAGDEDVPLAALGTGDPADDVLLALAEAAAAGGDEAMASSSSSFFDRWKAKLAGEYRHSQLHLLLKVLRALRGSHERAFDVGYEDDKYLRAATEAAVRGYDAVIYGHTHLPKCVPLAGHRAASGATAGRSAVYLNSGTWADVMAVPPDVFAPGDGSAAAGGLERLAAFADDLAANRVDGWRRRLPTFVRVEVEANGAVADAALETLDRDSQPVRVTAEVVRRHLAGEQT
jgi:UDP-2,3-diacylglucosamine pyrophosphatase LpxH